MRTGQLVEVKDCEERRLIRNGCRSPLSVGHVDLVAETHQALGREDLWLESHKDAAGHPYWFSEKSLRLLR